MQQFEKMGFFFLASYVSEEAHDRLLASLDVCCYVIGERCDQTGEEN